MSSITARIAGANVFGSDRRKVTFLILTTLLIIGLLFAFRINQENQNLLAGTGKADSATKAQALKTYGNPPIYFTSNLGQLDDQVKYWAKGAGYSFYLTSEGATYSFVKNQANEAKGQAPTAADEENVPESAQGYALKISFVGANPNPAMSGQEKQTGKVNYFIGSDQSKWQNNVATYGQVTYKDLYNGIDLTYKGDQKKIKYEFVVAPGASFQDIKLGYSGADSLGLDKKGNLLIGTPWGNLKDKKPYVYQAVGGKRVPVEAAFLVKGATVGFSLGAYNPNLPLVIDPGLEYSTFIGGSGDDGGGRRIAVDSSGAVYFAGAVYSSDMPTTAGAFDQTYNGSREAYVAKLNPSGSALIYASYFGGSSIDAATDLQIDSSGNAYVSGYAYSSNFPTTLGAYDRTHNGSVDAFIAKIDTNGALVYSTYLGGSSTDLGRGLAVDSSGHVYVTGETRSSNFPTTAGAYDVTQNGAHDIFITKLDPSGSSLSYSSFLGGTSRDLGKRIALDSLGNAYVTGITDSANFPTTFGAFDTTYDGGRDAYVAKLSPNGSALIFSTDLSGSNLDYGYGLAVDASGSSYVTGWTASSDFPTTAGAFDTTYNGGTYDIFIAKVDPSGAGLSYSTYLGTSGYERGAGIILDSLGNSYINGLTDSSNFPTTAGAFDSTHNGGVYDAIITQLDPTGSTISYSSYLGGSASEGMAGIALGPRPYVYLSGWTDSSDFPTTVGAFDETHNGNQDMFLAKLSLADTTPPGCIQPPSGLVSWWPGDGNADDIWDANPGTLMNGATFAPGKVDQAFSFDGVDDYVEVPDSASLDITDQITIDAWFYNTGNIDPSMRYQRIVHKNYRKNYEMWIDSDRRRLAFRIGDGSVTNYAQLYTDDNTIQFNTWYHVVAVYDGSSMKLYLNGNLSNSRTTSIPALGITTDPVIIGNVGTDIGSFNHNRPFNGLIDEVEIFNRALSQSEILSIYDNGKCKDAYVQPTAIVYSGDTTEQYSDIAYLKATLTDSSTSAPLENKVVKFSLGTQEATAATDLFGVAQTLVKIDQTSGTKALSVSFDGDSDYLASTSSVSFEVTKENTALEYLGETLVQRNNLLELKAALSEIDTEIGALGNKPVEFTIGNGMSTQTVIALTDTSGIATASETITVPTGVYQVSASFSGDAYYLPSLSSESMFVVWEPTDDLSVKGSGEIPKPGVDEAEFGFKVKYDDSLLPEGKFKYEEETEYEHDDGDHHDEDGEHHDENGEHHDGDEHDENHNSDHQEHKLKFESTLLNWMMITEQVVIFEGLGEFKNLPGIHTFRVTAFDYGKPGKGIDEFILEIDGLVFAGGTLTKGDIRIKD